MKVGWLVVSLCFIRMVTLRISPGHITEDLHLSKFGDWYAIILALAYNLFDLVGKFLGGPCKFMILKSLARVLFYLVLFVFTCAQLFLIRCSNDYFHLSSWTDEWVFDNCPYYFPEICAS
ncbi:hypothetical protein KP509_17G013100 [Ceratopteris richardii]|uniref:Uncharacterized protein n=1 Tax=Ceratopteris richardii TaxID=49495 RepID=A0A8T2SW07_CERRI|nr:hypothetical protein KP509_17G013100 [Ceratopteris richardii]